MLFSSNLIMFKCTLVSSQSIQRNQIERNIFFIKKKRLESPRRGLTKRTRSRARAATQYFAWMKEKTLDTELQSTIRVSSRHPSLIRFERLLYSSDIMRSHKIELQKYSWTNREACVNGTFACIYMHIVM